MQIHTYGCDLLSIGKSVDNFLITYLLNGAESSSEANRFSISQEIPCIL